VKIIFLILNGIAAFQNIAFTRFERLYIRLKN
jgi:hypothetical protein